MALPRAWAATAFLHQRARRGAAGQVEPPKSRIVRRARGRPASGRRGPDVVPAVAVRGPLLELGQEPGEKVATVLAFKGRSAPNGLLGVRSALSARFSLVRRAIAAGVRRPRR